MELSDSKIKKYLISSQKKAFLIIPEIEPCTFQPKREKKIHSRKISYTLVLKDFLYFLKKKLFLYFRK